MKIKIIINDKMILNGVLNSTETGKKVYASLPISGEGDTWGEEIYFSSKIKAPAENPRDVLEAGEIAYWPPLQAICLFYGPTPASNGDEIRAAGPVNIVGKITDDLSPLKQVQGAVKIIIEKRDN